MCITSLPVLSSMLSSDTCSFWWTQSPLHLKKICIAGTARQRNTMGLLFIMYASSGSWIKWGSVPGADGIESGRVSLLSFPGNKKINKNKGQTKYLLPIWSKCAWSGIYHQLIPSEDPELYHDECTTMCTTKIIYDEFNVSTKLHFFW